MSKADEIKDMQKKAVIQFCTADRLRQAQEECSELILAICKAQRYGLTGNNILEIKHEMADVENLLDQLKMIFPDDYEDLKYQKCLKMKMEIMGEIK